MKQFTEKIRPYILIPFVLQLIAWLPTRLLLNFFCAFEVRGLNNLRDLDQAIFASNHSNELDPIILTAALNPLGRFAPMFYVAAPLKIFITKDFGWRRFIYHANFFMAWGAYPIEKGTGDYKIALNKILALVNKGNNMLIFPEGRRTRDGDIQEFRGGAIFLSEDSGVPIVPCCISGTYKLGFKEFISKSHKIVISFEEAIYPEKSDVLQKSPDYYAHKSGEIRDIVISLNNKTN